MNHPPRLIDKGADGFELEALRAAEIDAGSDRAMRRALSAMGAAAALGTPAAAAALGKGAVAILVVKWVAVGAVVGASFALTAGAIRTPGSSRTARPSLAGGAAESNPAMAIPSGDLRRPPGESAAAFSPPVESAQVPAGTRAAGSRVREPTGAAPVPSGLTTEARLSREVALLDEARAALRRGDQVAALAALDQRQEEVGTGMLGPEATLTRVEALLGQGNRAAASTLAERFLAEHPRGPHADRLRSLLRGAHP
jgi:hypothetical protein